jgi:hypothetical protein
VGRLNRRLEKLEEERLDRDSLQRKVAVGPENELDDKQRWLEDAWIRRNNIVKPRHVERVRSAIRRMGKSPGVRDRQPIPPKLTVLTFEEAVEEIFEHTRPADWMLEIDGLKEGPSRELIERELALAIYREVEGTERQACPQEWRESFVAGDEVRDRYMAVPDEVVAKEVALLRSLADEELEAISAGESKGPASLAQFVEEAAGVTDELQNRALGPDRDRISQEEQKRRVMEYLSDFFFGEKAYRVEQLLKGG